MSTALVLDLDRVAATRLAFFLGIPALTGAGLYELKDAVGAGVGAAPLAVGTAVSFVIYRIVIGVALLGLPATGALNA